MLDGQPNKPPVLEIGYMAQTDAAYRIFDARLSPAMSPATPPDASSRTECVSMLGRWLSPAHVGIFSSAAGPGQPPAVSAAEYEPQNINIVWQEGCSFAGYNSWARTDGSLAVTEVVAGTLQGEDFVMLENKAQGTSYIGVMEGAVNDAGDLRWRFVGVLPNDAKAMSTGVTYVREV